MFLKGLEIYGKSWKKISQIVKTRTVVQIRTHAQKYLIKIEKAKKLGLTGTVMMNGKAITSSTKSKKDPKGIKATVPHVTLPHIHLVATPAHSVARRVSNGKGPMSSANLMAAAATLAPRNDDDGSMNTGTAGSLMPTLGGNITSATGGYALYAGDHATDAFYNSFSSGSSNGGATSSSASSSVSSSSAPHSPLMDGGSSESGGSQTGSHEQHDYDHAANMESDLASLLFNDEPHFPLQNKAAEQAQLLLHQHHQQQQAQQQQHQAAAVAAAANAAVQQHQHQQTSSSSFSSSNGRPAQTQQQSQQQSFQQQPPQARQPTRPKPAASFHHTSAFDDFTHMNNAWLSNEGGADLLSASGGSSGEEHKRRGEMVGTGGASMVVQHADHQCFGIDTSSPHEDDFLNRFMWEAEDSMGMQLHSQPGSASATVV